MTFPATNATDPNPATHAALHPESPSERRFVTVMFVDLSGFTSMSMELDPEALNALLNAYFETAIPLIESEGGFIDKIIGDGIMALFGAPTANVDDPARALRAALAIGNAFRKLPARDSRKLDVHIGVNTGLVVAGHFGAGDKKHYSVLGETVNVAARLESASGAGQILVGRQTYLETKHLFDFDPVEGLELKGMGKGYTAYSLRGPRAPSVQAAKPRDHVVRAAQAKAIRSALEDLKMGRGRLALVTGEALTGKSSLLEWAQTQAAALSIACVTASCQPGYDATPYALLRSLLESILGQQTDSADAQADANARRQALDTLMGHGHLLEAALIKDFLGNALPQDRERLEGIDPADSGPLFLRGLRFFFRKVLANRPLFISVDDSQWLDEGTCRALLHVTTASPAPALLVAFANRGETNRHLASLIKDHRSETDSPHLELALGMFDARETAELCRLRLGGPAAPEFAERLLAFSSGNPYILERLLAYLKDVGACALSDGAWTLTDSSALDTVTLTNDIHRLVISQVDRLDGNKKGVLRHAAIIGRTFPYTILTAIRQGDGGLDRDVHELEYMDILLSNRGQPHKEYQFKSPFLHSVVYESQLISVRRDIHNRIGLLLESPEGQASNPSLGVLAYHFIRAQNREKATQYLELLGDFAARFANDASSIEMYRAAYDLYRESFKDQADKTLAARFERKIGDAYCRAGFYDEGLRHLHAAQEHLGMPPPRSQASLNTRLGAELLGLGLRFLRPWKSSGGGSRCGEAHCTEMIHVKESLCWVYFFLDPKRYFHETLHAARLFSAHGHNAGLARSYASLGTIFTIIRQEAPARFFLNKARQLSVALGAPSVEALVWLCRGIFHDYGCRWEEALRHYEQARSIAWECGRLLEWGSALGLGSNIAFHLGRLDQGREMCRELRAHAKDSRFKLLLAYGLTGEGIYLKLTGEWAAALERFRESNQYLLAMPNYYVSLWNSSHMADCLMALEQPAELRACLEDASALAHDHGLRGVFVAVLALKRLKGSRWLLHRHPGFALSARHDRSMRSLLAMGRGYPVILPELHRLEAERQWEAGRRGKAASHWEESLRRAEELDDLHNIWTTLAERGRLTGDPADVERADQAESRWRARHSEGVQPPRS